MCLRKCLAIYEKKKSQHQKLMQFHCDRCHVHHINEWNQAENRRIFKNNIVLNYF